MAHVEWAGSVESLDPDYVEEVGRRWGVSYPDSYVQVSAAYHGASPRPCEFDTEDRDGLVFSRLLGFDDVLDNVKDALEELRDDHPENVFPFGREEGGGLLCFDYRDDPGDEPPIVLWEAHEGELLAVSDSFDELLDALYDEDTDHAPEYDDADEDELDDDLDDEG
jgi:hypothetical protein